MAKERIPNGRYTKEFREEAVNLVKDGSLKIPEVARKLSLPTSSLRSWVKASQKGNLGEIGKNYKPLSEFEVEIARLKRELAEVRMERDILKKATAYFARESLPGTR